MTTLSRIKTMFFIVFVYAFATAQQPPVAGDLFPRKYKAGEKYAYRLTTEQFYNHNWKSTTVVVIQVKVVKDSAGIPFEEVQHLSMKVVTASDTTDNSAEARNVKPYRVSLHPRGTLSIPPIEVPGMTGAVTDFITFLVAISPQSLVTTLKTVGDNITNKTPVRGNFANGRTILVGDDCLAMSARITAVTQRDVEILTSFLPPATPCLTYLLTDSQVPVMPGSPNNFQMVMPVGSGRFNLHYGSELFHINTLVSRQDGKIKYATMSNTLQLTLRMQYDADYRNFQQEMPFLIQRKSSAGIVALISYRGS